MKVGDYVRTKYGIKKVLKYTYNEKYENGHCIWFDNKDYGLLFTDEEVNKMKPSPNIIDLIEVGDYVNGYPIGKIIDIYFTGTGLRKLVFVWESEEFISELFENQIKSIVTKEQFESMEYKVGE